MCYELLILSAVARYEAKSGRSGKLDSYVGPVLLSADAAGTLVHEVIGHRVESGRLLSSSESGSILKPAKTKLMNGDLVFFDDPNISSFNGVRLYGTYSFDDEGSRPERAILIKDGRVCNILTTRISVKNRGHKSNGHARSDGEGRPTARMANSFFIPKQEATGNSWIKLKNILKTEIVNNKLPFGIIILVSDTGETNLSNDDVQAFRGSVDLMLKIYPDGKQEIVQPLDFAGTPLSSLSSIISYGDKTSTTNHYCGSDSGLIAVSTTSVAILMNKLELQQKSSI